MTTAMINIAGQKSENGFGSASLPDFIRHKGVPSVLRRDNAKAESNKSVMQILRDYLIGDEFSEAHNQQ